MTTPVNLRGWLEGLLKVRQSPNYHIGQQLDSPNCIRNLMIKVRVYIYPAVRQNLASWDGIMNAQMSKL